MEKKSMQPSIRVTIGNFRKRFTSRYSLLALNHSRHRQHAITFYVVWRQCTSMTRHVVRGRCTLCLDTRKPGRILPTLAIIDLFRRREVAITKERIAKRWIREFSMNSTLSTIQKYVIKGNGGIIPHGYDREVG